MADKRLRLIVEAVTSQAQQKLRSFSNAIRQFGDQAERSMDKSTRATSEFGAGMKAMTVMAGAMIADLIMRYGRLAAQTIINAEQLAAANLALQDSFEAVAGQYGLGSEKIIDAIQRASKFTIDRYTAMGAASTAMRLGVATDIDEFEKLMKIAYMRARETGTGVEEAWGWITRGIGRASPFILDNLNFLVGTNDVLETHAQLLGKTAEELSKLERQEALRNYVLQQGADDLERWNEVGGDAIDVFAEWRAASAELKQVLAEQLLPTVTELTIAATELARVITTGLVDPMKSEQQVFADLVEQTGSISEATKLFAENIRLASGNLVPYEEALRHAERAALDYRIAAIGIDQGIREDIEAMRLAEKGAIDLGTAQKELAVDTEEATKAAERAEDAWSSYLRNVAEQNWRFQRQVEDAQFRATQAAERALFQLMEIERDAADRRADLLESYAIRIEADTARHYQKLRWLKQDLMDELRDMEWEYQRDRSELLRRAPWWIKQALQKEFQERERIAATGNMKELRRFDKQLLERIKAIDPIYAQELELLMEHYQHQRKIERRETRQARRREKENWRIQNTEQERNLDLQLRQLERNLEYRLEAWHFQQQQREESEQWSMERMITENEHQLSVMYERTRDKLDDLPALYEHYGYTSWEAFVRGWLNAQTEHPLGHPTEPVGYTPGGYPVFQRGIEYVPKTMPAILHRGETVLPAPEAARYREGAGAITLQIENLNVYGTSVRAARQFVKQVESKLGQGIRRRSR